MLPEARYPNRVPRIGSTSNTPLPQPSPRIGIADIPFCTGRSQPLKNYMVRLCVSLWVPLKVCTNDFNHGTEHLYGKCTSEKNRMYCSCVNAQSELRRQ